MPVTPAFAGVIVLTLGASPGPSSLFWSATIVVTSAHYAVANVYRSASSRRRTRC